MIGMTPFPLRFGGYIIPNTTTDSENIIDSMYLPINSQIWCSNCTIEDESTLITNNILKKTDNGYLIKNNCNIAIKRPVENTPALTIMRFREILYCNYSNTDAGVIFNLPRGTRVNKAICNNNGENTFSVNDNYIIEL